MELPAHALWVKKCLQCTKALLREGVRDAVEF